MAPETHDLFVREPFFECSLCKARIRAAEEESVRLLHAGASKQAVLDAAHLPRFATFDDHDAAVRAYRSGVD